MHTLGERPTEDSGSEFDIHRPCFLMLLVRENLLQPLLSFESQYQEAGDC